VKTEREFLRVVGALLRDQLCHLHHLRPCLYLVSRRRLPQQTPELSLEDDAPDFRRPLPAGDIAAIPILGGLHHQYVWL
jgi:hypothetical protein